MGNLWKEGLGSHMAVTVGVCALASAGSRTHSDHAEKYDASANVATPPSQASSIGRRTCKYIAIYLFLLKCLQSAI